MVFDASSIRPLIVPGGSALAGTPLIPTAAAGGSYLPPSPMMDTGDVFRMVAVGDVHSRWPAVQAIVGHEFGNVPGVVLSTGDFIKPPKFEEPHHMFFVHGNHDRTRVIDDMRGATGRRIMTNREAIHRICTQCSLDIDNVATPGSIVPSGANHHDIEPGLRRIRIADLTPTQELVFVDSVADYVNRDPENYGRPGVRVIDGKIYVTVGHHRIMAEIVKGQTEIDVIVEGDSEEDRRLGMTPTLHTRHPGLSAWGQLVWRRGSKDGQLARSQYGNYHPIFSGETVVLGGLRVAGIPGIFAPSLYENRDKAPLKYFTSQDFEAMMSMPRNVDILLMHEAPFGVNFRIDGIDVGNLMLTNIIAYLKPRLVIFGHHHQFFQARFGETEIIGLDYPHRSYGVIEYDRKTDKLSMTMRDAAVSEEKGKTNLGYQYSWQSGISSENETRTLFDRRIPVDREQNILASLKRDHFESIQENAAVLIRTKIAEGIDDADEAATLRAGFALNTALPFAAKYAAEIESQEADDFEARKALLLSIYDEMTAGITAAAAEDVVIAFQECLKVLGLVAKKA